MRNFVKFRRAGGSDNEDLTSSTSGESEQKVKGERSQPQSQGPTKTTSEGGVGAPEQPKTEGVTQGQIPQNITLSDRENEIRKFMGLPELPPLENDKNTADAAEEKSEPPVVVMSRPEAATPSETAEGKKEKPRRKSVSFADDLEQGATPSGSAPSTKAPTSILKAVNKPERQSKAKDETNKEGKPETKSEPEIAPFSATGLYVVEKKRPPKRSGTSTSSALAQNSVTAASSGASSEGSAQSIQSDPEAAPISPPAAAASVQSNAASDPRAVQQDTTGPTPESVVQASDPARGAQVALSEQETTKPKPKQKLPTHVLRAKQNQQKAAAEIAATATVKASDSDLSNVSTAPPTEEEKKKMNQLDFILARSEEAERLRNRILRKTPSNPLADVRVQENMLKIQKALEEYEQKCKEEDELNVEVQMRVAQRQEEARKARAELARMLGEEEERQRARTTEADSENEKKSEGEMKESDGEGEEEEGVSREDSEEDDSFDDADLENPNEAPLVDDEGDDDPDTTRAIEEAANFALLEKKARRTARRLAKKQRSEQNAQSIGPEDSNHAQPSEPSVSNDQEQLTPEASEELAQAAFGALTGEAQLVSFVTSSITDKTYYCLSRKRVANREAHVTRLMGPENAPNTELETEADDKSTEVRLSPEEQLRVQAIALQKSRQKSLRALLQPYFFATCTGLKVRESTAYLARRLVELIQTLRLPTAIPSVSPTYWKTLAAAILLVFARQDGLTVPSHRASKTASTCHWLDHPEGELWKNFLNEHGLVWDSIYSYCVLFTIGLDEDD